MGVEGYWGYVGGVRGQREDWWGGGILVGLGGRGVCMIM